MQPSYISHLTSHIFRLTSLTFLTSNVSTMPSGWLYIPSSDEGFFMGLKGAKVKALAKVA